MANEFGKRLKELRKEFNVGQVALAKDLDVSKSIISLWENGLREPTISNLIKIADYFKVSSDYLLGRTDSYNF